MKPFVSLSGLILLLGVTSQAADEGGKAPLSVRIVPMLGKGQDAEPEETSSFALGETIACIFWAENYGTAGGGAPRLRGGWTVTGPDGKPLPMGDTGVGATSAEEAGPRGLPLRPILGWHLRPGDPAGCYWVRVTVTDDVRRATATAVAPLYLFLTAGAKTQITAPTTNAPMALDTTLTAPGLWAMSVDDFAGSTWIHGFAWQSEDHTGMRSINPRLTFLGQALAETKVRFAGGGPTEVNLSFYNRGDRGEIPNAQFTNIVSSIMNRLKALAGRPQDLTPASAKTSNLRQSILVWKREGTVFRLESAWSMPKRENAKGREFLPEYVNMCLLPASNALTRSAMAGTRTAKTPLSALARNVRRAENGDVYIEGVPMVDQGEKGYCAAAAAERILSYYGTDVDQHELAQRMLMQTGGGASFESLVRGLRAIAHTLNVQVKMLIEQDDRAFERLVEDYNKEARRARVEGIDLYHPPPSGGTNTIWSLFDKDLFLQSRLKERIAMEKFFTMVRTKVDDGIPVCQCCVIGILPEEAKLEQAPGGHLRLIVGYNPRTREVLYTDSWGVGHERKRMSVGYAFAITTGLFTLEPR
jgi:hypothetical protein